jgi:transposase
MKDVDDYLKVRHAVRIEGLSERAAARRFGIDPRTVNKMMKFSVPPGYMRKKPPAKPNGYIEECDRCSEKGRCSGFFTSGRPRLSCGIGPIFAT